MRLHRIFYCALAFAIAAQATTFRWTSQNDALTMDPHAAVEVITRAITALAYDALLARDREGQLTAWLAESWENPEPTRWIVRLRKGVRFHDGSVLTADDVVFSFQRASRSDSTIRVLAIQAGTPSKVDEGIVEFTTPHPNPVMLETLSTVPIMSKAWCERHGVARPQDWKNKEETHAVRNAMGTGPFILVSREPGIRTVHRRNPNWWGSAAGRFEGNVETVEHRPLENASTRYAALKSRQVDFLLDPALQDIPRLREDPEIRIWDGSEQRVVYVGFDLARPELLYSSVKGRNPFKDRRVRLALYQAIDIEALHRQVMRGASIPTGIALHDPAGAGVEPDLEKRPAFDPENAKRLLAEAGYPQGFGFTLHCPNDRMVNGERICVALSAMWARVGLDVRVESISRTVFIPKGYARDLSAYLMSYGGGLSDAIFMLKPVFRSPADPGVGQLNFGNVKDDALDALIDAIDTDMEPKRRRGVVNQAVKHLQAELPVLPLHRQVIPWASRSNVSVVHAPNNVLTLIWVRVR